MVAIECRKDGEARGAADTQGVQAAGRPPVKRGRRNREGRGERSLILSENGCRARPPCHRPLPNLQSASKASAWRRALPVPATLATPMRYGKGGPPAAARGASLPTANPSSAGFAQKAVLPTPVRQSASESANLRRRSRSSRTALSDKVGQCTLKARDGLLQLRIRLLGACHIPGSPQLLQPQGCLVGSLRTEAADRRL
jgi:hypothetical protein